MSGQPVRWRHAVRLRRSGTRPGRRSVPDHRSDLLQLIALALQPAAPFGRTNRDAQARGRLGQGGATGAGAGAGKRPDEAAGEADGGPDNFLHGRRAFPGGRWWSGRGRRWSMRPGRFGAFFRCRRRGLGHPVDGRLREPAQRERRRRGVQEHEALTGSHIVERRCYRRRDMVEREARDRALVNRFDHPGQPSAAESSLRHAQPAVTRHRRPGRRR